MKRGRGSLLVLAMAVAMIGLGCTRIQPAEGWAAPVEVGGRILVQADRGQIALVDRDTGAIAWQYPIEADNASPYYATPVVEGTTVYLASFHGRVSRIQAGSNTVTEDWSLQLDEQIIATPLLRGGDLFVPTETGRIVVVAADSGRVARTIETSERRMWGAPVASGSTLYIGDLDNRTTTAVNEADGEIVWEQGISGATAADLTLDGDLLLVGSFDQSLHALDITANGDERWSFRGTGWFIGRPLVAGNVVYAATMKGGVYAIDRDTGNEVWSQTVEDAEFRASPVIANGQLIAVARNGYVHAFSLASGDLVWSQQVSADGKLNADPLVDGTELYLLTSKERLIRVDLVQNGTFQVVPLGTDR